MMIVLRRLSTVTTNNIRNIGIAAHVDAGKTTVVERLLFFADKTQGMGEVHEGATTMDYLPQERERGITINSAAITFTWGTQPKHQINLIDTPGHFDFGFEVERSMRVIDGAVIVLDAVNGVEAQTEQVWRQASRHGVARILLANKMDRDGASVGVCVQSVKKRLGVPVVPIHFPLGDWSKFRGVADLVEQETLVWMGRGGEDLGRTFARTPWSSDEYPLFQPARESMLEQLADLDDKFADAYLSQPNVQISDIKSALKRVVLAQILPSPVSRPGVPLLLGAALRNTAMQPVLDAVIDFLPNPAERACGKPLINVEGGVLPKPDPKAPLCALVFKVQHDPQKGALVFVRVYAGTLAAKDMIVCKSSGVKERVQQVLRAEANEFLPAPDQRALPGEVCVLVGCSSLRTGDTLGPGPSLTKMNIQPPIFSVSLELESLAQETKLDQALQIACRDDPSLSSGVHADTGQLLLSGVGELHLDVAVDRLKREHGLNLYVGRPQVALREQLVSTGVKASCKFDRVIASVRQQCRVELECSPLPGCELRPTVSAKTLTHGSADQKNALISGTQAALSRGPTMGQPVFGLEVTVVDFDPPQALPSALRACASMCVQELYTQSACEVLEPVFKVEITCPEKDTGPVLSDLTSNHRAEITSVESTGIEQNLVHARIPAKELLNYSKALRSLTAGHGSYAFTFDEYSAVPESALLKYRRGE
jgi:elongation factor G